MTRICVMACKSGSDEKGVKMYAWLPGHARPFETAAPWAQSPSSQRAARCRDRCVVLRNQWETHSKQAATIRCLSEFKG